MPIQSGAKVTLRGPSGVTVKLDGEGYTNRFAWEPERPKRIATELEIRAKIIGSTAGLGQDVPVRMAAEIGHGKIVWNSPNTPLAQVGGDVLQQWDLPARGLLLRIAARELRLAFTLVPGSFPAIANAVVQVSVQPVQDSHLPVFPYAARAPAASRQGFPLEAQEWRLTDANGQPLAVGAVGLVFGGLVGSLFGPLDGALVADWRPIPHNAVGWVPDALCFAQYR